MYTSTDIAVSHTFTGCRISTAWYRKRPVQEIEAGLNGFLMRRLAILTEYVADTELVCEFWP